MASTWAAADSQLPGALTTATRGPGGSPKPATRIKVSSHASGSGLRIAPWVRSSASDAAWMSPREPSARGKLARSTTGRPFRAARAHSGASSAARDGPGGSRSARPTAPAGASATSSSETGWQLAPRRLSMRAASSAQGTSSSASAIRMAVASRVRKRTLATGPTLSERWGRIKNAVNSAAYGWPATPSGERGTA